MCQRECLGGTVEPHRVGARNIPRARGRNVDRAWEARPLHRALEQEGGARGRVLLRVMMSFVKKRAEVLLRGEQLRGLRYDGLEYHHAGRKIGRGHDTSTRVGDDLAELRLAGAPA